MLTKREVIAFLAGVLLSVALLTFAIQRTDTVQRHVCESSQKVRKPFLDYFLVEDKLLATAHAQHIPLGPPALAKIQAQSEVALHHLEGALRSAVVTGCTA